MDSAFCPPRTDAFPAGLRVLVVDDDPTWLKILEKMLKKCLYEVTICGLARDALNLLRERKDGYDIVISDVNMPDMDGFKLLELVGLEMDLPVIMMSVDGETSRVMKGVQHGACDYLLKPIRMKELRNIWQHVFRKKINEVRDIESHESMDDFQIMRNGPEQSDDGYLVSGDPTSVKKRKDTENKHDDRDHCDPSSVKKARVVWSVDLHQKFVRAVNQIGFDKVGPKKILDLMNVPWLTRENVASHLQKYRLYLSRLQKEDDLKTSCGGIKHSDLSPKDSSGSFGLSNLTNMHQNDAANSGYGFSGNKKLVQSIDIDPKVQEGDLKGIVSLPRTEQKKMLTGEASDPQKARSSQMGFNHSFGSIEQDVNYAAFDSSISAQYSWSGEKVPEAQFQEEHRPSVQLETSFNQLPVPGPQHHIQVDCLQPTLPPISPGSSRKERDKASPAKIKPLYASYDSHHVSNVRTAGSEIDLFSVQSNCQMVNPQAFEPISNITLNMRNQGHNQSGVNDLESFQRNLISVSGSALESLEDLQVHWLQGDCNPMNLGQRNIEFSDYHDQKLITEVPFHLYDPLKLDYEYLSDLTEYPIMDQGLFIA